MTATNKVTKLFTYLADNGTTRRDTLMSVLKINNVQYFQTLLNILRKTQMVWTLEDAKGNISYMLCNTLPRYTFDGDKASADEERARYRMRNADGLT